MSKYVIEFDKEQLLKYDKDTDTYFRTLYKAKGFNALVFDKNGLDKLTPLDKELEEAYQKGFEAGQHEATTLEYQQGLDDAWECMKAIAFLNKPRDMRDFFGCSTLGDVLIDYTASEAIEKLKAYGEQQKADERIMFGDGLVTKTEGLRGIALSNEVNGSVYVWREDCVAYESSVDAWKKTGETYPQIAELLKAMKGEQRDCHTCKHQVASSIECVDCRGFGKWEPKEGAE